MRRACAYSKVARAFHPCNQGHGHPHDPGSCALTSQLSYVHGQRGRIGQAYTTGKVPHHQQGVCARTTF